MHNVSPAIWNQIAEQEELASGWAQQMFPLPAEDLDLALEREADALRKMGATSPVIVAYLTMLPLVLEREAIARFLRRNPGQAHALPDVEGVDEAVMLAAKDHLLTDAEKARLADLLNNPLP